MLTCCLHTNIAWGRKTTLLKKEIIKIRLILTDIKPCFDIKFHRQMYGIGAHFNVFFA
jgi:hypothetical protein